jgi:hypothetical protein
MDSFLQLKMSFKSVQKKNVADSTDNPSPVLPAFPSRAGGIANTTSTRQKQRDRDIWLEYSYTRITAESLVSKKHLY